MVKETAADLGAWLVFEDESISWSEATGRTVVVAHARSQDVRVDRFGDPLAERLWPRAGRSSPMLGITRLLHLAAGDHNGQRLDSTGLD